jgi:hypothetical protein
MKWQAGKEASCQNGTFAEWQVIEMNSKLAKWQFDKMVNR